MYALLIYMGVLMGCSVKMTGENRAKKNRDPIFTVCLVIFVIAAVAVIGVQIQKSCFPSGDVMASTGDEVTVNYIGTFYDEYGKENAVVFDTSLSDIAGNDGIAKSNDFTKKSSYSPLGFEIGDGSVLAGFSNAVIGHKVGETFKVKIDAIDGYVSSSKTGVLSKSNNVMSATTNMTKTEFTSSYSDVSLVSGQSVKFTSNYGWDAYAVLTDNDNMVVVTYKPVAGESYKVFDNGTTKVNFYVSKVGTEITYNIGIDNPKSVDGGIQMIKLDLGDKVIYITDIKGDSIYYKEGSEKENQDLYFEITLVSIN